MSASVDRTKHDAAPALLAWHAEETNRLLKVAVDSFFVILDGIDGAGGKEAVGVAFCPFLDAFQDAGDQFDCLYHMATGKPNA